MTTLYSCKSEITEYDVEQWRITKFDGDMNVESSYVTDGISCTCPAGERPSCRHRQMLPRFLTRGAVNTMWMHDFDRNGWVSQELEISYHKTLPDDATPEQVAEALAGLSEAEAEHSQEQGTASMHEIVQAAAYGIGPCMEAIYELRGEQARDITPSRPTRITLNRRGF